MNCFQLDHPLDETILCDNEGANKEGCDEIADYLEIDDQGHEFRLCKLHTSTDKHASQLPKRPPKSGLPYRSRPAR
jgi:hypothetical protein